LIDTLLKILDTNPEYKSFTLDAEMVNLEDYLDVKPENEEKIRKYIQEGRILIGPWYVAADEFLVGGESLIRNLLWGQRMGERYGGFADVGYLPDQFGHISQMPQVLRGFGINSAIIWRGIGIPWENSKSEFLWEGPDGSEVLVHRLPSKGDYARQQGYHNAAFLPTDGRKAYRRVKETQELLSQYTTTPNLLLMNGHDFVTPRPDISKTIEKVNKLLKNGKIVHSNLPQFIQDINRSKPRLTVIKGEFYNCRYSKVHPGVLSARIHAKQANEETENLLYKWAEPFAAISWINSRSYPGEVLGQSCKYLLKNHPHDTIYGCSVDEVDKGMMARYFLSREISEEVVTNSLNEISSHIDTSLLTEGESCLVVFNPLNWVRTDLVTANVCFPEELKVEDFTLEDCQGNIIPYYLHQKDPDVFVPVPNKFLHFSRNSCFQITFLAEEIPAFGYKSYLVKPGRKLKSLPGSKKLSPRKNVLENEYIQVKINKDGTFDLFDKMNNIACRNCHTFEDGGDIGSLYDYSYPQKDEVVTSLGKKDAEITLKINTEFMTEYEVKFKLFLPTQIDPGRKKRSKQLTQYPIVSKIRLFKGAPRVDVETTVVNKVKDHRLQVLFPSGIRTDFSHAEGQFDVIKRPVKVPDFTGAFEDPMPFFPQRSFVDVSGEGKGLAILNRGLPSYEVIDDKKRTVALTLLRCVEWVTAPGLLTTRNVVGNSFWGFAPEGQCLGKYIFHYSLYPHRGDWEEGKVYHQAYQHNIDCRVVQTDKHKGGLPSLMSFVTVEPDNLIVSCFKKAEGRNSLILRLFNTSKKRVSAKIRFYRRIKKVYLLDLNERREKELKVRKGTILYSVPGKKIITFELIPD